MIYYIISILLNNLFSFNQISIKLFVDNKKYIVNYDFEKTIVCAVYSFKLMFILVKVEKVVYWINNIRTFTFQIKIIVRKL